MMIRRASRHGGYGWKRGLPDARDAYFAAFADNLTLPPRVDMIPAFPPCYDQGQLGSCTANGIAGAIEFDRRKQGRSDYCPSRLFIYYNERVIEDTVNSDAGAEIRDGIKTVVAQGAPPEADWPYDITQFATRPPPKAYTDALTDLVKRYARVGQNLHQMQSVLASGYPIVIGFSVYDSFESDDVAATGVVPMPGPDEALLGGHCVLVVGYDNAPRQWICRNSWGTTWGMKGNFVMPYEYLLRPDLSSDFWVINAVS